MAISTKDESGSESQSDASQAPCDGTILYFAYGSNLAVDQMQATCPSAKAIGRAILRDHRLAFTRQSKKWGGGVADVVRADGFCVWGIIYRIPTVELAALDTREGTSVGAYARSTATVVHNGTPVEAEVYTVVEKHAVELRPTTTYLETMRRGALGHGLPDNYQHFLAYLTLRAKSESFGAGLLIAGTRKRRNARGEAIAQVHPCHVGGRPRYVAVGIGNAWAAVLAIPNSEIPPHEVRLDQSVRHAYGIRYPEQFGFRAEVQPLQRRPFRPWLVRPRTLYARVWSPSWADSERQLCVLHPNHLAMLGLVAGDYVTILAAAPGGSAEHVEARRLTLRCFTGSETQIRRAGQMIEYPRMGEVYLDADARDELALVPGLSVVRVAPAIGRLFRARVVLYGSSFLLSVVALAPLVQEVAADAMGRNAALALTLTLACLATCALAVADLRSRHQY